MIDNTGRGPVTIGVELPLPRSIHTPTHSETRDDKVILLVVGGDETSLSTLRHAMEGQDDRFTILPVTQASLPPDLDLCEGQDRGVQEEVLRGRQRSRQEAPDRHLRQTPSQRIDINRPQP